MTPLDWLLLVVVALVFVILYVAVAIQEPADVDEQAFPEVTHELRRKMGRFDAPMQEIPAQVHHARAEIEGR